MSWIVFIVFLLILIAIVRDSRRPDEKKNQEQKDHSHYANSQSTSTEKKDDINQILIEKKLYRIIKKSEDSSFPVAEGSDTHIEHQQSEAVSRIKSEKTEPNTLEVKEEEEEYLEIIEDDSDSDDVLQIIDDEHCEEDEAKTGKKNRVVYVGIDFGTSYTKVAYYINQNNKGCLKSNGDYFIPTAVYFNGIELSVIKKRGFVEYKYFKYLLLNCTDSEKYWNEEAMGIVKKVGGVKSASSLFSVFFLANILEMLDSELKDKQYLNHYVIHMGTPFSPGVVYDKIWESVIYSAKKLFEKGVTKTISVEVLWKFYNEACSNLKEAYSKQQTIEDVEPIKLIPEIIAESDFLLRQETYGASPYVIIDVGGGTIDYAYIIKKSKKEKADYDALEYEVCQYGVETKKLYGNSYIKKVKESFELFMKQCHNCCPGSEEIKVTFLLYGGGQFDAGIINLFKSFERKIKGYRFFLVPDSRSFPKNYYVNGERLSEENKRRMIIASQLAYPDSPSLEKLPYTKYYNVHKKEKTLYVPTVKKKNASKPWV